ncbi:hypothetical protein GCK32_021122 [Trichostrongylus colubriformis]|uniref:Uncharacterized protein n=1 Tax=Trichostrongylus colubriformis TaxID=6319 RepID=A0AAN8FT86_TRICO
MKRVECYPVDEILSPATPPSSDSDGLWPEGGVYTEDEDNTVEITYAICRKEKQWLANLRALSGAIQAEILIFARKKAEMQRTM